MFCDSAQSTSVVVSEAALRAGRRAPGRGKSSRNEGISEERADLFVRSKLTRGRRYCEQNCRRKSDERRRQVVLKRKRCGRKRGLMMEQVV